MLKRFGKSGFKPALLTCCVFTAAMLAGCATTAVQYNADNIEDISDKALRPNAAPLETITPLTIDQVRERTLSHNTEYRRAQHKLMETMRKAGNRGEALLPQAYANSHSSWRNNAEASTAINAADTSGNLPSEFFTAQDRAIAISNFTASWDLLEIGLSAYKANSRTINVFKEDEQNQYLCNQLIVDVENAYWRAVAFEQAEKKAEWLKNRVNYAINLSQERAKEYPDTKLSELMFQRGLIDINRWYQSLYRSLISAKPNLARLMNLPVGVDFELQSKRLPAELGPIGQQDVVELINAAYKHRPEIRQALYNADLTQLKNEEDLWRHLPGLRVFLGGSNNTNSFVMNSNFASAGANLSWDLMRLGQINETRRNGELALENKARETEKIASAVMAQVMIAREQMHKLNYDLTLAWKALFVQAEITEDFQADVDAGKKPETHLIQEEVMRELSYIREQIARAELHTAKARLQQSIGLVPICQAPEPGTVAQPQDTPIADTLPVSTAPESEASTAQALAISTSVKAWANPMKALEQ